MNSLSVQIAWLFILALPISCMAWTVTHAELFREAREYFIRRSQKGKTMLERKFFFLFICDYCFSHYVTILILFITKYKLLFDNWRGYLVSGFSLVLVANFYMGAFSLLHLRLKSKKLDKKLKEELKAEKERMKSEIA
jgi:hypothetical protein